MKIVQIISIVDFKSSDIYQIVHTGIPEFTCLSSLGVNCGWQTVQGELKSRV